MAAIEEARQAEEERVAGIRRDAVRAFDDAMVRGWAEKAEEFDALECEASRDFAKAVVESAWGKALLRAWAAKDAQRLIASMLRPDAERAGLRPPHEPALREHTPRLGDSNGVPECLGRSS
ncbi:MAG: hypothetical protein H0W27_02245 [Actinobacteria bacterium]|nr:hypothetical protein [Actinomycetota bacterium]